jgi:hypothetical protein
VRSKTVLDVARELAAAHRSEDPETSQVYVAPADEEVRLIEITTAVVSDGAERVLPFRFPKRPDLDIPFDLVVILLSPEEWAQVQAGRLALPEGWGRADTLQQIA